ncbi:protein of unknown function [uncultured Sphingopyxis sp.]|uniref:Uncharacterized protein n=1 Tax=uncultured Sphingopyxis sp. TaxID=310581 RepID=A0A1Y5PRK0_9SPHN|nr:protein of unknown function [uncultured Sphingopyxis sp.]
MLDQQAESFEPGRVCQCGERCKGGVGIHASELSDGCACVKTYRKNTMHLVGCMFLSRIVRVSGPTLLIARTRRANLTKFCF